MVIGTFHTPAGMDGLWSKLAAAPEFDAVAPNSLDAMANAMTWRQAGPGCTIIDGSADAAHPVYLLADGTVSVVGQTLRREVGPIHELDAVSLLGGYAWIAGEPGSTTVSTKTDCLVGELPGQTYLDILKQDPAFMLGELQRTIRTIRRLGDRLARLEDNQAAVDKVYSGLVRLTL